MSKRRRITIQDSEKELRDKRGPNGFRLCRWCKKEVHPPRRTFCSDECIHLWKLRSNPGYVREHVYKRDLGICALCKSDTRLQKIQLENALRDCSYDEKSDQYKALLIALNITATEAKKSLWDADHIVPVAEGGGLCGLEFMQTLCKRCHKLKSGKQMNAKAKPRKIKQMKLGGVQGIQGFPGIKGLFGKIKD